ncbi:WhiB family transcriptional regulator [Streptomyces sp. NPDC056374]|uniref:WhiB family transcriptional regulator n=1 Tax=unclassified Streptomyces TaxID=2593676 RepID=UPI0035D7E463
MLPSWFDDGLCAQTDPDLFFPEKGGSTKGAKDVCQECPIRTECADYAIDRDERWGVWGGLSEKERRRLRSNRLPGQPGA